MSRSRPDPDKWVSANKVDKQPTQRPIVDTRFRAHVGIATPPASTAKKRAASNKPRASTAAASGLKGVTIPNVTPTAPQRSIASFFTPPTTGPSQRVLKGKGKGRAGEEANEAIGASSPLVPGGTSAFPSSLPQRPRLSAAHRAYDDHHTPEPQSSSQFPVTQFPEDVLFRHARLCGQDDNRPEVLSPWRREAGRVDSQEERDNRRAHQRYEEVRRVEERAAKRQRMDENAQRAISKQAVDRTHAARERRNLGEFKSLAHLSSSTGSSSPTKKDREASPSERPVLGQRAPNVLTRYSSAIEPAVSDRDDRWPKSKRSTLPAVPARPLLSRGRASEASPRQHTPRKGVIQWSPKDGSPKPTPRKRNFPTSPKKAGYLHQTSPRNQRFIVTPQKPAQYSTSPHKRRSPHHKVTPPKLRTPQKPSGHQETLFLLPDPPPPLVFEPAPRERSIFDFEPVDMEPETLMTWSMGGETLHPAAAVQVPREADSEQPMEAVFDDAESIAGSVASQTFPHLVETASPARQSPARKPPTNKTISPLRPLPMANWDSARSPTRSPSPMVMPQILRSPGEVPSRQPSSRNIPTSLHSEPDSPGSPSLSPPGSPKRLVRRAHREFKRINLFSSVVSNTSGINPLSGPSACSSSSESFSRSARATQQAKLEAFGYKAEKRRSVAPADFDTPFSDEEDLDFGQGDGESEPEEPLFAASPARSLSGARQLAPVPDAPPHPSLRPAGVREVRRRELHAMARHHAQAQAQTLSHSQARGSKKEWSLSSRAGRRDAYEGGTSDSAANTDFEIPAASGDWAPPPSTPTDASSSVSDAGGAPRLSRAAREWWDQLGRPESDSLQ